MMYVLLQCLYADERDAQPLLDGLSQVGRTLPLVRSQLLQPAVIRAEHDPQIL